ncbi:membrane protein [Aeromonas aquatica]|uniref:COG4705 family protein n=1 Tax=Aeromonas aquatica TaxID=558964 RepID=UPI00051AAE0E|nr:membrane protein [Aeromonas aquatica]
MQYRSDFVTTLANKVPEVTLIFWIIKMMSTTVGETAADYLIFQQHLGLTLTSALMGTLLVVVLALQIKAVRYEPWRYWLAVVLVSIFGTLLTDNLTDRVGIPLWLSTSVFTLLLLVTFAIWFRHEGTLSINSINTLKREKFYWLAILVTFALGTAAGDWVSEGMDIGYLNATLLFGGLIALTAVAHKVFRMNTVLSFWIAYVLTRPLGASVGDLLSQSVKHGGLGYGVTTVSEAFFVLILLLVGYLTLRRQAA